MGLRLKILRGRALRESGPLELCQIMLLEIQNQRFVLNRLLENVLTLVCVLGSEEEETRIHRQRSIVEIRRDPLCLTGGSPQQDARTLAPHLQDSQTHLRTLNPHQTSLHREGLVGV